MCIIFVRLQSDFSSLYAFEEALIPKLYVVILTVCAVRLESCSTTGVTNMMLHYFSVYFTLFEVIEGQGYGDNTRSGSGAIC